MTTTTKQENIYIGIRKNDELMNELGFPYHLNEGLQKHLRTTAMNQGIKKTEQGQRLEFYSIGSMDNVKKLQQNKDLNLLVFVDGNVLSQTLKTINSKYGSRMTYEQHKEYKKELSEGFRVCLQKIGQDTNNRKKVETFENPYKVGDWIPTPSKFRRMNRITSEMCRVYKTTAKSYWVELPIMIGVENGISNGKYARNRYNGVNGLINETDYQADENWTIPYNENKSVMSFVQMTGICRVSKSDSVSNVETDTKKQGYKHSYRYW